MTILKKCIYDSLIFRENFEVTKEVIVRHKAKTDRQYNGQKNKYNRTNNDPQRNAWKNKKLSSIIKIEKSLKKTNWILLTHIQFVVVMDTIEHTNT